MEATEFKIHGMVFMEFFDITTLATPAAVAVSTTAILQYFKLKDLFNSGALQIRVVNLVLCIFFITIGKALTSPLGYETIVYSLVNGLIACLMSAGITI